MDFAHQQTTNSSMFHHNIVTDPVGPHEASSTICEGLLGVGIRVLWAWLPVGSSSS